MTAYVTLPIEPNRGYSPAQVVGQAITLRALADAVADAIRKHGEDTPVVLDNGQMFGARWGTLSKYADLFEPPSVDDEGDDE